MKIDRKFRVSNKTLEEQYFTYVGSKLAVFSLERHFTSKNEGYYTSLSLDARTNCFSNPKQEVT
jgi:hypothetical protein